MKYFGPHNSPSQIFGLASPLVRNSRVVRWQYSEKVVGAAIAQWLSVRLPTGRLGVRSATPE